MENLGTERWRKLVWNIPFNGLAVRERLDTERILGRAELRGEVEALMQEVLQAAACCGHALPPETIALQLARTEEMGPYRPSTLIDYEAGKALELESIWGEPLRRSQAKGASSPRLSALYHELSLIDRELCARK